MTFPIRTLLSRKSVSVTTKDSLKKKRKEDRKMNELSMPNAVWRQQHISSR